AAPASYLGAAARAAARQREIDRLAAELAELDAQLSELDAELSELDGRQRRPPRGRGALPGPAGRRAIPAAGPLPARATRRPLTCAADLRRDQERHAAELARRDTAWARFADYAGTHRFGLRDLDKQGEALRTFESRLTRLAGELGVLAARQEALQAAEAVLA